MRTCVTVSVVFGHGSSIDSLQSLYVRCWTECLSHCPPPFNCCCICSRRARGASPFFGQCTNECTAVLSLFIMSNRRFTGVRVLSSWSIVAFSGRVARSLCRSAVSYWWRTMAVAGGDGAVQLLWVIECRRLVQSYSVAVASCQSFLATLRNWCAVCVCWLVGRAECNLCIISRRSVPATDGERRMRIWCIRCWIESYLGSLLVTVDRQLDILLCLIPYVQFVCFIGVV